MAGQTKKSSRRWQKVSSVGAPLAAPSPVAMPDVGALLAAPSPVANPDVGALLAAPSQGVPARRACCAL